MSKSSSGKKGASQGVTLGLRAYEKISAVEGITLSEDLKRDLQVLVSRRISPAGRTRLIASKYGKSSA